MSLAWTTVSAALVEESTTSTSPSLRGKFVERERSRPESVAKLRARLCSAVRDVRDRRSARREVHGCELADPARADEQHAAPGQIAEDLLRKGGCRGRNRRRVLADRGLGADALPDLERLPEDAVEQRPGRRGIERRAHLAENLALAGNERVETGGNAEEVDGRCFVVQPVDDGIERLAGQLLERCDGVILDARWRGRSRCGCTSRGRPRRQAHVRATRRERTAARRARAARPAQRDARFRRARASKVAPGERDANEDDKREANQRDVGARGGPIGRNTRKPP